MKIDILSLFPGYFQGPFDVSILKRAREKGLLDLELTDIRDYAEGKHRKVDDRPFGGGPGMVLMAEPTVKAIRAKRRAESRVIYLSPQGTPLTAGLAMRLSKERHLLLLSGHYEGVDERILREVDEEISIGDYVLTNGCIASIVLVDALMRFIPGVLGDASSASQDSFQEGLFDAPHYTHPVEFEGKRVPDVLLSGNHAAINKWRKEQALEKTGRIRPELLLRS